MKYLETPTDETWYINGMFGLDIEKKVDILRFMYTILVECDSKKIYWHKPGNLKHIAEKWIANTKGGHPYVERASCVAAAIMIGIPVKLDKDAKNNLIGLHMSQKQMDKIYYNVCNNITVNIKEAKKEYLNR
tara:strand:- start:5721 stop:6116 length:396 start_codon:yes stop_codon:yes gene_type:complete